eukprot:363885_1
MGNKQSLIKTAKTIEEKEAITVQDACSRGCCEYVQSLSIIMIKYNKLRNDQQQADFCSKFNDYKLQYILNLFDHLLFNHNLDNDEYRYVYQSFGGKCKMQQCSAIRRHWKTVTDEYDTCLQTTLALDILTKIHCHFQHQYDIFRMTETEQKQMDNIDDTNNDEEYNIINNRVVKAKQILTSKKAHFLKLTNSSRFETNSKFASDLAQIRVCDRANDEYKDETNKMPLYSYSFNFNYWDHCKNLDEKNHFSDATYSAKQLYVPQKHSSLKCELLNNIIFPISLKQWNKYIKKAEIHKQTDYGRTITAQIDEYCIYWKWRYDHPTKFGYIEYQQIPTQHLCVVMIYCDLDEFQRKFSKTYRAMNDNDNLDSIKQRHSNFHHFAKTLKETVEVFGIQASDGDVQTIYHGINKEMVFESMNTHICAVMSTTSSLNVAIQFSNNSGLVLELVPNSHLKYFTCCWLSHFSAESELLFIGGFAEMTFINITNTITGHDFYQYILALRIIDRMTSSWYFCVDATIYHKIKKHKTPKIRSLFGGKHSNASLNEYDIPIKVKKLVISLLEHECNRYKPNKFIKYSNKLPDYIDMLLHQICKKK